MTEGFFAEVQRVILTNYPAWVAEAERERPKRADDFIDDIARALERLTIWSDRRTEQARGVALQIGEGVSEKNRSELMRIGKTSLGIDLFTSEPWLRSDLRAFAEDNARLINTLPQKALTDVGRVVSVGVRQGQSLQDVTGAVAKLNGVTLRRAKLIARDQVGTLNSQLTQLRQREIGVTTYEWNTVRDERVRGAPSGRYPNARPRHDVMHGMLCRWDDPTVYQRPGETKWLKRSTIGGPEAHPGEPIMCRCF